MLGEEVRESISLAELRKMKKLKKIKLSNSSQFKIMSFHLYDTKHYFINLNLKICALIVK